MLAGTASSSSIRNQETRRLRLGRELAHRRWPAFERCWFVRTPRAGRAGRRGGRVDAPRAPSSPRVMAAPSFSRRGFSSRRCLGSRGGFSSRGGFGAGSPRALLPRRTGLAGLTRRRRWRSTGDAQASARRDLGDHHVGGNALVAEKPGEGTAAVGECREQQLALERSVARRCQPRAGVGRATTAALPRPAARRSARAPASARSRAHWRVRRGRCRPHRAMTGQGRWSAAVPGAGARSR